MCSELIYQNFKIDTEAGSDLPLLSWGATALCKNSNERFGNI